jgi:hypothetical protein
VLGVVPAHNHKQEVDWPQVPKHQKSVGSEDQLRPQGPVRLRQQDVLALSHRREVPAVVRV